MKFRDLDGQFKDIVIKTGDTLPVGSVVEYEGSAPPAGWSKLSDGGSVIVSSEEPTTGEEVWIQTGRNLFDKNNYRKAPSGKIGFNLNLKVGETYTISSNKEITAIKFAEWDTQSDGTEGPQKWDKFTSWTFVAGIQNRVFLSVKSSLDMISSVTELDGFEIQIEKGEVPTKYEPYITKKIYTKNSNGSYEEFYNEENNKYKNIWGGVLKGGETLSIDLKKYKSLKVYFHSYACTGVFELDLKNQVSNVIEDNFKFMASCISGYYSKENTRWESHCCQIGVSLDKLTFKNIAQGYFYGTTFNERNNNAAYHVYKIEGLE